MPHPRTILASLVTACCAAPAVMAHPGHADSAPITQHALEHVLLFGIPAFAAAALATYLYRAKRTTDKQGRK